MYKWGEVIPYVVIHSHLKFIMKIQQMTYPSSWNFLRKGI